MIGFVDYTLHLDYIYSIVVVYQCRATMKNEGVVMTSFNTDNGLSRATIPSPKPLPHPSA